MALLALCLISISASLVRAQVPPVIESRFRQASEAMRNGNLDAAGEGFAAVVKSREPEAPLWSLMFATVCLDIVFVPLFLTHIETTEAVRGTGFVYGGNINHADYMHSFFGRRGPTVGVVASDRQTLLGKAS